jgi:urate oxidase
LKIKYGDLETTIKKGLEKLWEYMDRAGTKHGHLVIFDKNKNKTWDAKIFYRKENYQGINIAVWGM